MGVRSVGNYGGHSLSLDAGLRTFSWLSLLIPGKIIIFIIFFSVILHLNYIEVIKKQGSKERQWQIS